MEFEVSKRAVTPLNVIWTIIFLFHDYSRLRRLLVILEIVSVTNPYDWSICYARISFSKV